MSEPGPAITDYSPFVSYGASHWCVLIGLSVACLILVLIGRHLSGTPKMVWFNRGFAIVVLAVMVPMNVYLWFPSQWDLKISLPFDLCDLAWMAAAYALWTGRASCAFGLLYYW